MCLPRQRSRSNGTSRTFRRRASVGSSNDFDICIYAEPPGANPLDCARTLMSAPIRLSFITLPGGGPVNVVIFKYVPDGGPDPLFMKWISFDDGVSVLDPYPGAMASTVFGQPNAAGAIGVGAAFTSIRLNSVPIRRCRSPFPRPAAHRSSLTPPEAPVPPLLRLRPQFVAPDGGNTTFFGSDIPDIGGTDPDSFRKLLRHLGRSTTRCRRGSADA